MKAHIAKDIASGLVHSVAGPEGAAVVPVGLLNWLRTPPLT
jgi:hypothetical protein